MIKKLYLNHVFVISQKAIEIMYVLMLMRAGYDLNLNFFPLAQLFLLQQGYRMASEFY